MSIPFGKINSIKREGRIFNSLEFSRLGEMNRKERRREIISKIIKFTRRTLEYENIALWELSSLSSKLLPIFSRGYGYSLKKYSLEKEKYKNGIVGFVAVEGYPYISRNVEADPHYLPGISNAQSSITVPCKIAEQVFGVLNVESEDYSAFKEEDVEILKEYSVHVALALNIRRLLDKGEEITTSRTARTFAHEVNNPLEAIFIEMSRIDAQKENLSDSMISSLREINQNLNLIKGAVDKLCNIEEPEIDKEYEIIAIEEELAGRRVLVVEDDPRVRKSLKEALEDEKCTVDEAEDGVYGIEKGLEKDYDIIITDIKMPRMNGYEVFRHIREKKTDQKMVMMTGFGYDESHSIVKSNEEGLNGVLYKPFTPELLKKVLSRACS